MQNRAGAGSSQTNKRKSSQQVSAASQPRAHQANTSRVRTTASPPRPPAPSVHQHHLGTKYAGWSAAPPPPSSVTRASRRPRTTIAAVFFICTTVSSSAATLASDSVNRVVAAASSAVRRATSTGTDSVAPSAMVRVQQRLPRPAAGVDDGGGGGGCVSQEVRYSTGQKEGGRKLGTEETHREMLAHNNAEGSGRQRNEVAGLAAVKAAANEAAAAVARTATSKELDTPTGGRATPAGVPRADSAGGGARSPRDGATPRTSPGQRLLALRSRSPLSPPRGSKATQLLPAVWVELRDSGPFSLDMY